MSYRLEDLREGLGEEATRTLSEEAVRAFIEASGDASPIHIDDQAAQARGFDRAVAHGAIIDAFISEFIGMRLPGDGALLQKLEVSYVRPSYLRDVLRLEGRVSHVSSAVRTIRLAFVVTNLTQGYICARASAQVGIL